MSLAKYGDGRPISATDGRGIALGLILLVAAIILARAFSFSTAATLFLSISVYVVPIAAYDLIICRVHLRTSTGLDWSLWNSRAIDGRRIATKLIGMVLTFTALGVSYYALPAEVFEKYQSFASFIPVALPPVIVIGSVYVALLDRVMIEPRDGLHEFGSLVLLRFGGRDWTSIRDHVLGWTIKGFFLPQMFGFLAGTIWHFLQTSPDFNLVGLVEWLAAAAMLLELVVVVSGYSLTARLLDAHIRSPNSLWSAWSACLVCYFPFNTLILAPLFPYRDGLEWDDWFGQNYWLAVPWALAIVGSYAVWVWATAIYGLRWSNLTNRGIITNGPYRFTKHPDYLSKTAFWWLTSVPFLSAEGWQTALLHSGMLIGVNLVYLTRARTEERHLLRDPTYVEYARWIEKNGAIARLRRLIKLKHPAHAA